eukprot:m.45825 g.45825  ORF g.45825 m.45825 type:complete len:309 (+) comp11808_c0_seq4:1187-2113(+)
MQHQVCALHFHLNTCRTLAKWQAYGHHQDLWAESVLTCHGVTCKLFHAQGACAVGDGVGWRDGAVSSDRLRGSRVPRFSLSSSSDCGLSQPAAQAFVSQCLCQQTHTWCVVLLRRDQKPVSRSTFAGAPGFASALSCSDSFSNGLDSFPAGGGAVLPSPAALLRSIDGRASPLNLSLGSLMEVRETFSPWVRFSTPSSAVVMSIWRIRWSAVERRTASGWKITSYTVHATPALSRSSRALEMMCGSVRCEPRLALSTRRSGLSILSDWQMLTNTFWPLPPESTRLVLTTNPASGVISLTSLPCSASSA